jgi:elongation factor Ts
MTKIPLEAIKELRQLTACSVSDCRRALKDSGGDIQKAVELLRKLGLEIAARKQSETANEGRIEAYVHLGNKLGVLLELNCQTDFVAKNSEFAQFAKDIAMHIAALNPLHIKREDVPAEVLEKEKDKEQFLKENCLLEQPFVKDPAMSVKDCLGGLISKFGENIAIRRFVRYKIG